MKTWDQITQERRRALENEFFLRRDRALLERLRAERERASRREALGAAVGIRDPELLEHIDALGLTPETVAALTLIPLVEVAWADGRLTRPERHAMVSAAESLGLAPDSPARKLFESWLETPPGPELFDAWRHYVESLVREAGPEALVSLKRRVMEGAGLLAETTTSRRRGVGPLISRARRKMLRELEKAFGPR